MAAVINYRDIRFDAASGVPYYTTSTGGRSYLSPLEAASSALMFAPAGPERDALLTERGYGPDLVQQLEAYASSHGITSTNPFDDQPGATFLHARGVWNTATGRYDVSLNQGGILGLIEGAAAVAAPAIILPLLTGSPTIFSAGAAASSGAAAPGSVSGALPAGSTTAATVGGVAAAANRSAGVVAAITAALGGGARLPGASSLGYAPTLAPAATYSANTWLLAGLAVAVVILATRH